MTIDISSYTIQKVAGFPIVRSEIENKTRQLFSPADITFDLERIKQWKSIVTFLPENILRTEKPLKKPAL